MVVSALGDIGISSPAFTWASCRMGGLTVATEAGVPESIMWMQSGHAQDRRGERGRGEPLKRGHPHSGWVAER